MSTVYCRVITTMFFSKSSVLLLYFGAGRNEEALEKYKRAEQLGRNNSVVLVNMGRLLRSIGRTQDAEELYKRYGWGILVDIIIRTPYISVFLFVIHCRALAVKREANTLQLLGALYFNTDRLSDAEATWKEALKIDSSHQETLSNYVSNITNTLKWAPKCDK